MRILLLNQFFYPDSAATSQLLTDLARELADKGHEVVAICGKGSYGAKDSAPPPAVKIVRSPAPQFSHSHLSRAASYAGYFFAAAFRVLRGPPPQLVLTLTTPPLLSLLGTLAKRIHGSQHIIWEMDLYPDVAVDLGFLRPQSLALKLIGFFVDFSRRSADGIIALGEDMRDRLLAHGISAEKIQVVHNWANSLEIRPHAFPPGPLTVHYSGNLGLAHDTATIMQTMLALADDQRVRFIFAGGGPERKTIQQFCKTHSLTQATFRPYCERHELSDSLSQGHLGLVTQKNVTAGSIVPSKVYGIMAAGRPLLYIGPQSATPARIIERFDCGWRIEVGDSEGLVRLLHRLQNRPDEILKAGERARKALVENFDKRIGVARIIKILAAEELRVAATA